MLLEKGKVHLDYVGLPFRWKWKLIIHIFMVDRRSTGLPECGPTKYPASEPCLLSDFDEFLYEIYLHQFLLKIRSKLKIFTNGGTLPPLPLS